MDRLNSQNRILGSVCSENIIIPITIETAENSTNSFVYGDGFVVSFVQDGDPTTYRDPSVVVTQPSVVYDDIYEAAKNNGREYDWWAVT